MVSVNIVETNCFLLNSYLIWIRPDPDQVTIEQKAIGLNYIDTYHRSGLYPLKLPIGLGLEGAGVITDVGENVKDFKVGDKISYAGIPLGSYASHRNYPAKNLVKVPDGIDLEIAISRSIPSGTFTKFLAG